jgi:hypothetical protein
MRNVKKELQVLVYSLEAICPEDFLVHSLMYILAMSAKAWSKLSQALGSTDCLAFMAHCMTLWWALRASK